MTIAVDFDGTIVEDRYPKIGKPVPYAFETLISLQKKGHKIILWTVREGALLREAVDYCSYFGLEFYAVNSETPEAWKSDGETAFSSRKLRADIYVDDRGVAGLPDWATIGKIICGEQQAGEMRQNWQSQSSKLHSDRKSRKKGLFKRIAERCRQSRERLGQL